MKYDQRTVHQTAVVYLYDPIPLDKVLLDTLKLHFPRVVAIPDQEVILAESPDLKVTTQIQTARIEYTDQSGTDFDATNLKLLANLLNIMPPFNLKAYGINLHLRAKVSGYALAGAYAKEAFLADWKTLEGKLGQKIIGSAHRFLYGELTKYFDVRITPVELDGELLHFQVHMHKELHLTDWERILDETLAGQAETVKELARLEELL